ncbi:5-deoxy-glucuronate isomerase [Paenibacillus hamazuiensis]|uniref:5-deoxy-glucuronate isomerase n=1 Tax=Paenibacillus hamazuiensis TaxID=2936508 RepID=UPI00200F26E8|nr:5-deoxy-glucuronate isomerase [Paenibacillus hamazuiensis]
MNASRLIVKSTDAPGGGTVLSVTPESAGWEYVGFEVVRLLRGQTMQRATESKEVCLVLLGGKANVATQEKRWEGIGERASVFDRVPPYSVYVPSGDNFTVEAVTDLELAVCSAPGKGTYPARLIPPAEVGAEPRGQGNTERWIHNILPESSPADSLLVVEVYTPNGHWSSYPPHKHDQLNLPEESFLEETYYHKVKPEHGFAVQRVYTDDLTLDETMIVRDGDAVLVPKGYHPVSAPPGYDLYYLNVMAGPVRTWKFKNDKDHEWIFEQWKKQPAEGEATSK